MEGSRSANFVVALISLMLITYFLKSEAEQRDTEFVRSSCNVTLYPQLCFSSLSSYASDIHRSPLHLANTSISVALATAKSTLVLMVKLAHRHGLKPKEIAAMRDCVEEMSDSTDQLRRSIGEMNQLKGKGSNFRLLMSDIQTWISAALTDENTCLNGFEDKAMNGKVKDEVRSRIVNIAHLTSNALVLINSYAKLHG